MEKKAKIAVVVAVIAALGWCGWMFLRWQVVYRMKIQEVLQKKLSQSGRFAAVAEIVALPDMMKQAAQEAHVPSENIATEVTIIGRNEGPIVMYFLHVKVTDGSHAPLDDEVGVNRDHFKNVIAPATETLEHAGVKFKMP